MNSEVRRVFRLDQIVSSVSKKSTSFSESDLPFLGLEHISPGSMLIQGTGDSADVKSEVNLFDHGDILYGKLRPYFRKSSIVRFRGGCSTEILVLRPNKGFSRGFAFALISSSYFSELATSISTGTGLPRTQWNSMKSLKFDIPSHDVCEILGEIADDINSLRHLQSITNSLILEIISSLFRSWFIDFDPVKAKAEGKLPYGMDAETAALFSDSFEISKFGEIPTGWKYVLLEDLATLTKKSINPKRTPEEEFFHYSIPAFDKGGNPILTLGCDIESNKFVVPDNCVLLSKLNPKWNRVWIPELLSNHVSVTSTEFLPWVPKNGVSVNYLYSLMVSQPFRWLIDSRISGTTVSHQRVSPNDCAKIPCLMPSLDVMDKFHKATEKMFELMKNSAMTQHDLVTTRDVLLPRLMSGELKVN